MKILYDATELSYYLENSGYRAGVFVVAYNLFKELKKHKDVDITLFCNFKRYYFMKEVINKCPEFENCELLPESSLINRLLGKLNYLVRKCPRKITFGILSLSRFYENLFYISSFKNRKNAEKYDIYLSPFTPPSNEILESKKLKRFMMLHDVIPIIENNSKITKNPRLWHYKLYNSINSGDYYFTNSEYTRRDILKYFPLIKETSIKTALLGANENFCQTTQKPPFNEKYVFSLCSLGKRKNLEFGIKNFFTFIEKHGIDDLKLILSGSVWNKYKKELDSILNRYDRSKVILTGYLEENELPKYYSNALMFIFPSLYEGFGLPVLEAMQCGCPVITSNVSSIPEVIGGAGIMINPLCDNEMVKAYEKMYFDVAFREECRQKGIERARLFSWEKCVSEILCYISEKTSDCK